MPKPSRADLRLYLRALRQGWTIPADVRTEVIKMLREIVTDEKATRREKTSAARAVMQASRVELDAIRVAHGARFEEMVRRVEVLEGKEQVDGGLAQAASGH
jgi:putative ubiquitin-RnfH superfamily antitoxin RatB of RatAB toxin-antitoxin module